MKGDTKDWRVLLPAQREVGSASELLGAAFFSFKFSDSQRFCDVTFSHDFMTSRLSLIILRGVVKFSKQN